MFRPLKEKLAATYSRGVYKTTTIGKTAFDGRVRNGNGSDRSFMATKKSFVSLASNAACLISRLALHPSGLQPSNDSKNTDSLKTAHRK